VFPMKVMSMLARNDVDELFDAMSTSLLLTMTGMDVDTTVFRRRNDSVGAKLVFRNKTRKS
jgi:hypothetical protein